jgi:ABC-type multidrug transport system fused ATPase/permease subunit
VHHPKVAREWNLAERSPRSDNPPRRAPPGDVPRDIDETIALAGLTEKASALGTRLSGGQRRRLDFALALIGDPEQCGAAVQAD